ncbi:threonine-phosphate decarboxylase CobD [Fulvimarina sp. MAC3]|uniref:threonine-phosphate decarboxylase CobD n=1 Tax=Fulvimarina sp. MAC3 TaxID=3148887 RepID=UPI0031FC9B80
MTGAKPLPMVHGGNLDAAIARFGGTRADWLDLSTGINPAPPVLPAMEPADWSRLPEEVAEHSLIEAARAFYGARQEAGIVIAPGTQILISLLPFVLDRGPVAILAPTYSEHAEAFGAAGHDVRRFGDVSEIPAEARLAVLVNPNNPDGRRFEPDVLLRLADRFAEKGGLLIVDEAFADTEPEISLATHIGREGLLVYRSFGKFTGFAGLRLGFALATPRLAQQLATRLGPWAISTPALTLGETILTDGAMLYQLRRDIAAQSERLGRILAGMGLAIVGETALFKTVSHPHAPRLHQALCERHILTRAFDYAPTWLRFGNPRDDAAGERLEKALGESLAEIGPSPGDVSAEPG